MNKEYYLCTEILSGGSPVALAYDVNWDLDISDLVRVKVILNPGKVFDSFMLDVYSDLDGLSTDVINDFFNSETTESLLLGLIQLIKEKLFFNPLDIKGGLLTTSEEMIMLDLLIKVDTEDYSISTTDFNLVFGFAFSELTVSSIIGSYLVKKGHELHHLYYEEN